MATRYQYLMLCIVLSFIMMFNVGTSCDDTSDDGSGVTVINLYDDVLFVYQPQKRKPTQSPTTLPTMDPTVNPTNKPTQQRTSHPTSQPTAKPTKTPTNKPTQLPTAHPTKIPTSKPTNNPTATPTKMPTGRPTDNPTDKPTKIPTNKPTKHPTLNPTQRPTEPPSDAWDKQSARIAVDPKPIGDSSKPPDDHQLLNQALLRNAVRSDTKLQNTIKLFDYTVVPGVPIQEMEHRCALHQEILSADKENKLIIVPFLNELPQAKLPRVAPFLTDLDAALNKLDQVLLLVVDGAYNITSTDIDEKAFADRLSVFVDKLRPLRVIHQHIVSEFVLFYTTQNKTDAGRMFLKFTETPQILGTWPLSRSPLLKYIALRFLLIAYHELLNRKVEETNHLITNSSYALSGKIPRKFKTEFEGLRRKVNELSQMKRVIDDDMPQAFSMLDNQFLDLSLYAFDLQCARVIHDVKSGERHFGTIVISSSSVASKTDIDELLKVLGYSEDSIFRYHVHTTRKRHSGYNFKATPYKLSPTSKLSNNTVAKKKRKQRKSNGNKTGDTSSNSLMKHHSIVEFIAVYYLTDLSEIVDHMDRDPPSFYKEILTDPQYDVVIIQDQFFLDIHMESCHNRSQRYAVYDVMDKAFDDMISWVVGFIEMIPTQQNLNSLITLIIHQFGNIVFDLTKLDKSHLDIIITELEMHSRPMSQLIVIIKILYVKLRAPSVDENDVAEILEKHIKNEHVNAQGGKLIQDMQIFVECTFMHIVAVRFKNLERMQFFSRLKEDETISASLREILMNVKNRIEYFSKHAWSKAVVKYIAFLIQTESRTLRNRPRDTHTRMDILGQISNVKAKMDDLNSDFTWLKAMCRIGDIISDFQQRQNHDHGRIAFVACNRVPQLYDLLHCFGYCNETIVIAEPVALN
eukprot:185131_1